MDTQITNVDSEQRGDATVSEGDVDYWQQVYADAPPALQLPFERSDSAERNHIVVTEHHVVSLELSEALKAAAHLHEVSLRSLLLSALGILMGRLSGQSDFAIGVPLASLAASVQLGQARFGAAILPLRMQMDPRRSFVELACTTDRALLDAASHLESASTGIPGNGEQQGVDAQAVQTSVIFDFTAEAIPSTFGDFEADHQSSRRVVESWGLRFSLGDNGTEIVLDVHYAVARHDATTVQRWIRHYVTALSTVAANQPGAAEQGFCVDDFDLLDAESRREVLDAWNDTSVEYDRQQSMIALIKAQMGRTPLRIAAECHGDKLDYEGLDIASRNLALALGARGLGRGDRIGVCVPRSLAMLVGVLGVLRSGAAYVPLDPTFPADRLEYMAEHSRLRHVLVTDVGLLPATVADGRELLNVDLLAAETADGAELPEVRGDDMAYVLYTSGSTGKPKGVGILHRNLVNFLLSMAREPGFTEDDTLCAATTLSFDIAGLELYLPLITGGRIVIATDEERHELSLMWDLIDRSGCNVLQVTPSVLRLLQDTGHDRAVSKLRLFVGGEALPLVVANSMAGRCREFWNLYGPTETTIWSTVARIRPGISTVPLGRPIANTQVYVLDAQGRPVLPGAIGEIWIGGDGVAAGYLFQPELSAERFVTDSFVGGSARMYRTGDLGTWRDGILYFHGRTDHQIKIRGFRIEPGDIEAAADSHPSVRESVVVVRQFGDNDARLVMYVAVDGDVEAITRQLREHLRERLPRYMLPQNIEVLSDLPKTPNGKVDRNALPTPTSAIAVAESRVVGVEHPAESVQTMADPREIYLANLWRELIGVQEVQRNDNFLDLGGHSLLAVEFVVRVKQDTAVDLRLLDVASGTLASLAVELPSGNVVADSHGSIWSRLRRRLRRG